MDELPGLLTETSLKTGGLCGLQTATKIIRRITSPPRAMPSIAAFGICAAKKIQGRDDGNIRNSESIYT